MEVTEYHLPYESQRTELVVEISRLTTELHEVTRNISKR